MRGFLVLLVKLLSSYLVDEHACEFIGCSCDDEERGYEGCGEDEQGKGAAGECGGEVFPSQAILLWGEGFLCWCFLEELSEFSHDVFTVSIVTVCS